MKYSRIRDVLQPTRGTEKSAGIDFYIPKFTETFVNDLVNKNPEIFVESIIPILIENKTFLLAPQKRILIPSGIKVEVPLNYALIAFNKSGVSTKKGLDVLACVIDEDYQGEIHLSLVNTSNDAIFIKEHEKIVQFILIPVLYAPLIEVNIETLYDEVTARKDGGFGSTDAPIGSELR